jgi:hypothetical protein
VQQKHVARNAESLDSTEPTEMTWFPVAAYVARQYITVYLVNS